MRSGPISRISALIAVSSTISNGRIPTTKALKKSPPAWNSPMNHSAALARAPKNPVGSSTVGSAAYDTIVAASEMNGMITPVESASVKASP